MRRPALTIVAAVPITITCLYGPGVARDETAPPIPSEQQFVFEISHENAAWGYRRGGRYIDNQGGVFEYQSRRHWRQSPEGGLTEADLLRKFAGSRRLDVTVDQPTLRKMYTLIESARKGGLSDPRPRCRDAGTIQYLAYVYDGHSRRYQPVLLYQAGDIALKNQAEAARVLYEWLFTLSGGAARGCDP